MKVLNIGTTIDGGRKFTLPIEAITQTFAILAKREAGKTYTASVLVEELIGAGAQVVVIDPTDVWWGLRASADGKASGLPVYVFGGEHGDLPLDAAAGAFMADVVVEQGISVVLSLRHLSKRKQRDFVAAFAERLYDRKGQGKYRTPLHMVVDEADFFVPQRLGSDTASVFGAIDDIVRKGRNVGFGVTLISQRPATLNKDVLTQCEVMVALRTISPQDRGAVDAWVIAHDVEGHRAEFMASLASLDIGEAWVWSPGWLNVFVRIRVRQRTTFNSSATPKPGEKPREPKKLANVDLAQLREQMATVVKEAEAKDPKKLQAKIRELEKQLTTAQAKVTAPVAVTCTHAGEIRELRASLAAAESEAVGERNAGQATQMFAIDADKLLEQTRALLQRAIVASQPKARQKAIREAAAARPRMPVPVSPPPVSEQNGNRSPAPLVAARPIRQATSDLSTNGAMPSLEGIKSGAVRMLGVLAAMGPLTRFQLGSLTGFTPTGGTFGEYMRVLRRSTFADEVAPGVYDATPAGIDAIGGKPPPPGHEEVMELWKSALKSGAYRMLEIIIAAGDGGVDGRTLAEESGFTYGGGTYGEYTRQLRKNGLASDATGVFVATDVLFP